MSKIRRTYKYRLWPNRKQREVLFSTLEVCRQLYNLSYAQVLRQGEACAKKNHLETLKMLL